MGSFRKIKGRNGKSYVLKACAVCQEGQRKDWCGAHPDSVKASKKKWAQNNKKRLNEKSVRLYWLHPERSRAIAKKHYYKYIEKNRKAARDRVLEKRRLCPEAHRAENKQWRDQNPETVKAMSKKRVAKRRALQRQVACDVTTADIKRLQAKARSHGVCPLCLKVVTEWHLEHAVPLARLGGSTKDNLYFCCKDCNLRKGKQTLEAFAGISFSELPVTLLNI